MTDAVPTCPYCGSAAQLLLDSSTLYRGRDYGPLWVCAPCDARVGCHPGTTRPLGRLANAELRSAKMAAHRVFDPLWMVLRDAYPELLAPARKHRGIARMRAYRWLAEQLHIPLAECHIGLFDVALCRRTVEVIQRSQPTSGTIRAWAKELQSNSDTSVQPDIRG